MAYDARAVALRALRMAAAGTIFALAMVVRSVSPASASTADQAAAPTVIPTTDVAPGSSEVPPVEPTPTPEPPPVEEPAEPLPPGEVPPADEPRAEPPPVEDQPAETPPSDTAGEQPAPSPDPPVEPLPNVPPPVDAPPPAIEPVPPTDSGNEPTCCDVPGTAPPIEVEIPVVDPPVELPEPPAAPTDPAAPSPVEPDGASATGRASVAAPKNEPSDAARPAARESVEAAAVVPASKQKPPSDGAWDADRPQRPIREPAVELDGAAAASAGIAAGLAVVNRAPAGVAVALEFGRLGGGWAGAIVFNLWLRRQLSSRRMSQRQLAALSGVDHTTISRLLREDRQPSLTTATKIVRALRGVPPEAAEPATADYFDRMPEETVFPARRVELALRADDQLDDEQVRRLMTLYLTARRRSAIASRGDPESVPANGRTTVAPGSRR